MRDNDVRDLPFETFRQLRSLRELSIARIENRIREGICLHRDYSDDPQTARGFIADEILEQVGSAETVQDYCGQCPANVSFLIELGRDQKVLVTQHGKRSEKQLWAGCFGWFRSEQNGVDLPRLLTKEAWHKLWRTEVWQGEDLQTLRESVSRFTTTQISDHFEFSDFMSVVECCSRLGLRLETELVPRGHSDGLLWTIEPHCRSCRCEMQIVDTACPVCGIQGGPRRVRPRKVLGLRPYLLLKEIIGMDATNELLRRFRDGG
jgi:hypothetical protein